VHLILVFSSILYSTLIISLIWARFRFFKKSSTQPTMWVVFYDPVVAIQIIASLYAFAFLKPSGFVLPVICAIFLIISLSLFWSSIFTANSLDFAFSSRVGKLIRIGPYSVIRHPFYLSYILAWLSTTLLFNSIPLWFTLVYLVTFYISSARSEEKVILQTEHSSEYLDYRQNVGMFLPRIWKWKN